MSKFVTQEISVIDHDRFANDRRLQQLLDKNNYPFISRALAINSRTVEFLIQERAVFVVDERPTLKVTKSKCGPKLQGSQQVWAEFVAHVERYFMNGVGYDERWVDVAKYLATYIHNDYLKQLPAWPATQSEQRCCVVLDLSAVAQSELYQVFWSASGNIDCLDRTTATHFEASIYGTPTLKGICIKPAALQYLESLMQQTSSMNPSEVYNWIEFKISKPLPLPILGSVIIIITQ